MPAKILHASTTENHADNQRINGLKGTFRKIQARHDCCVAASLRADRLRQRVGATVIREYLCGKLGCKDSMLIMRRRANRNLRSNRNVRKKQVENCSLASALRQPGAGGAVFVGMNQDDGSHSGAGRFFDLYGSTSKNVHRCSGDSRFRFRLARAFLMSLTQIK